MMLSMTQGYNRGGVQTYGRRMAEILSEYAQQRDAEMHGVSLQDDGWKPEQHPNPVCYASFGAAAGSKPAFVALSARTALRVRPRVAVVMHTCIAPVAWVLRKSRMTGPYILVLHGIEAWRRVDLPVRTAAAGAHRIVATTHHTVEQFAHANEIPEERFAVIPLAIPESEAAPVPPAGRDRELRLLTAGRLTLSDASKGFDTLISATGRARTVGANVKLRIVGAGDDLPRLQLHAAALGLDDDCVRFLGSVPDDQLRQELKDCHLFAMPSRSEGFGIVYLEAMCLGRPCIAGNHGGPPEIIDDGKDGYLVEHGDVPQLTTRLLELYRDPNLRRAMGRNAALKVESQYLFTHMRDRWFNLLDTACE